MPNPIKPLSNEQILSLLSTEKTRSTRGGKVDITVDRTVPVWMKLNHHMCLPDCEHRTDPQNPTALLKKLAEGYEVIEIGNACWNPDCVDTRDRATDRGVNIVAHVVDVYMCRYCFLAKWRLSEAENG